MPSIDLSTAEFVVETLRKLEDLGESVTDTESTHIARIEVAHGDETVGYFVHEEGSWAYEPTGEASHDEDAEADEQDVEGDDEQDAEDVDEDADEDVEDEEEDVEDEEEDVDTDETSEDSGDSRGFRR
jgi:hypothetical protein